MNYLAHLYLSGDSDNIKIGNFIGDFVKGKNYENYPELIKNGILLHRQIDTYTDNHYIVKEGVKRIRPIYNKYSGVVIDIFYDHFLASNWDKYSNVRLKDFVKHTHKLLISNYMLLPSALQKFLPFLISGNRLISYSKLNGIEKTLNKMVKYRSLPNVTPEAIKHLKNNYEIYRTEFDEFINDIKNFVINEYDITFN